MKTDFSTEFIILRSLIKVVSSFKKANKLIGKFFLNKSTKIFFGEVFLLLITFNKTES